MSTHTALHWLKEWQDLAAGVLGFGGAVGAVLYSIISGRTREKREALALRQSLGVEVRSLAANALRVYTELQRREGVHTAWGDFANGVRFVEPTIYRHVASKISILGVVAGNSRRWWRNSGLLLNRAFPIRYFDQLGVPRLAT